MSHLRLPFAVVCLVAATAHAAAAQQRRVTGTVRESGTGQPVSAATIQVVGTNLGALTNDRGEFAVTVPAGPQTLRVRRIGYKQGTVSVGSGAAEATVALARDVLELETQVVTGTATTVSSLNAANDVAVVSSERLNRVPSQNIDQALQGKIAGAIVSSNSGAPGGGTQIQLRGTSTILGSYSPLYVIDGVIANNETIQNGLNVLTQASRAGSNGNFSSTQDQNVNRIADLNPNDIESVQVLKGPSAASIYGSKGANGVIIITTKQGRAGPARVEITQRVGQSHLSNTIPTRCFASAQEYVDFTARTGTVNDAADKTLFDNATTGGVQCHDFQKEFYNNDALGYQTIAQVRGGTNTGTNYFISGLVQHDNGIAQNDMYNKQSLRLNLGQTIGSRLTVRGTSSLTHTLTKRGVSGNDNSGISPIDAFSVTPSFIDLRRRADGTYPRNPFMSGGVNPFQNADALQTPDNVYRLEGSVTGQLSLISTARQSLDYVMTGGIDAYNDQSRIYSPASLFFEQANANPGTVVNSSANVRNANLTGSLAHRFTSSPFTATSSVGFRQERRELDIVQITGRGLPFAGVTAVNQATQIFPNEVNPPIVKDVSFFFQEEFLTLAERLLLTAGVNAERSSNNGDQTKFYGYPKFSASYRVPWLPATVSDLKLRAAYGRAGNFPTVGRFTFATTLLDEGIPGARLSTIKGAESIKPEVDAETEGGFDLTLFNGRALLKATQWRKVTNDLLLQAAIAPSTGFTSQYINGGQLSGHGTEFELNLTPVQHFHGVDWQSTTTYSSAKSRITRLPVPAFNPGVGSFGTSFGNVFIQRGQSPSIIQSFVGCNIALPASGACPTANKIVGFVGDANPDYQMGFNNDFTVGPFRLGTLLDWRKGGKNVNLTNNYFDGGLLADTATGNARLRAFRAGQPAYVENSGFVKLREVTLGYTIPTSVTRAVGLGRATGTSLELSGRNLYTWTKYTGLDPEVSNYSNVAVGRIQDVTPYPPSRSFFLSINTNF